MSQDVSTAFWMLWPDQCPPAVLPDAMKPRMKNQGSVIALIEGEIAHLRGLDLKGLRIRWHGTFRKKPPAHSPRHRLFAPLPHQLQADRIGDLDHNILKMLNRNET